MLWCIHVVLLRKKAAPHNNRIHFVLFVCVLCTMWCFVWFLHEMVLLLHENLNYCTKRIWCLCKLQNKTFSMVCCTTLWWDGAGKGRGWKTAAIIYCWQQQRHVRDRTAQLSDISSGATCVADLDSGALALTKEASGNSRGVCLSLCLTWQDIVAADIVPCWVCLSVCLMWQETVPCWVCLSGSQTPCPVVWCQFPASAAGGRHASCLHINTHQESHSAVTLWFSCTLYYCCSSHSWKTQIIC